MNANAAHVNRKHLLNAGNAICLVLLLLNILAPFVGRKGLKQLLTFVENAMMKKDPENT